MKGPRDPALLIGLLLILAGLTYSILASLPMDMDECIWEEEFDVSIYIELQEPGSEPDVDILYWVTGCSFRLEKKASPWEVEILLYIAVPRVRGDGHDAQVELALLSPYDQLRGITDIHIWGAEASKEVRRELGTDRFRFLAEGLSEGAVLEVRIAVDVIRLRAYLQQEFEHWYTLELYSCVSILVKSRMEPLSYRSVFSGSLGLACMAFGLRRNKGKALSRKLLTSLILSLALIVVGDVLLHYAWYRIANMRVSWTTYTPFEAVFPEPAPPPPLSPGPWRELWEIICRVREVNRRHYPGVSPAYFPIPDEFRGYSMRYINILYSLTYLSWAMMIVGLCIFLPSSAYALWVPRAQEISSAPGPGATTAGRMVKRRSSSCREGPMRHVSGA